MTKRTKKAPALLEIPEDDFLDPLGALHRASDSVIGFLRKNGEHKSGVENIGSIKRSDLKGMLPKLAEWLLEDAYFTVNGYNAQAPYTIKKTGQRGVWRKEKNLRYLNAVYADLDIGRVGEPGPRGLSVSEGSQLLIDLLTGGTLPQLSMSAQSGRGLYALWILRDDDDEDAPVTFKNQKSFGETLALYKAVNRAIYKHLECLAADKICDGARVLRVPGTLHTGSGGRCFYKVTFDRDGKLVTYTLKELAEAFGVPVLEKSLPSDLRQWEANDNPTNPKKANGPKALAAARARDLVTLEQWRGGWQRGQRRFCLRTYAQFLKAAGTGRAETDAAVEIMASNCNPPYPSDVSDQPLKTIVNEVWLEKFATLKQMNLVKWLQITSDEARELELEKLIPIEVQDERTIPRGGLRLQEKAQRHAVIQKLINERGMMSTRELVTELKESAFVSSVATVHRDLIELGYQENPARKRAGRKPSEQQMTLPA